MPTSANSGPLTVTELDTPSGLAAACTGELLLVGAVVWGASALARRDARDEGSGGGDAP